MLIFVFVYVVAEFEMIKDSCVSSEAGGPTDVYVIKNINVMLLQSKPKPEIMT